MCIYKAVVLVFLLVVVLLFTAVYTALGFRFFPEIALERYKMVLLLLNSGYTATATLLHCQPEPVPLPTADCLHCR